VALLFNSTGQPEPSPEIQRRLRALDHRLYLEFVPHFDKHWALKCRWKEGDRRWERVQTGSIAEAQASDIVGWLPIDCSVDEAPAYLERSLSVFSQQQGERLLFNLERWNGQAVGEQHIEQVMDELSGQKFGMDSGISGRRTRHVLA